MTHKLAVLYVQTLLRKQNIHLTHRVNLYLLKCKCKTSVPLWTKPTRSLMPALASSNNQADTALFQEILPTHKTVPYV